MFWKYDDEKETVVPREEEKLPEPVPPVKKDEDGFLSSDEAGAAKRFEARVAVFQQEEKPVYKHHFWWFVHNCVAHPMIGILPNKTTFDFHDWTSKKINGK